MRLLFPLLTCLFLFHVSCITGVQYYWSDWNQGSPQNPGYTTSANIATNTSNVIVSFSSTGDISGVQFGEAADVDYFESRPEDRLPNSQNVYTSSEVSNKPPLKDIVRLRDKTTVLLTFSTPVVDPVLALVSTNGNTYEFTSPFKVLSLSGSLSYDNGFFGNGLYNVQSEPEKSLYRLIAVADPPLIEPHGTIQFIGTFTSLTWTTSINEEWHGFTVGIKSTQTEAMRPNVGIEIAPSSVIAQPISTLSLRATAYSSYPACEITSYAWSTVSSPIPAASPQPIFTAPTNPISSVTGLNTIGAYVFQIVVTDCKAATIAFTFNARVVNSTLDDFFVLPTTIVTTPGFVFPPTLPPTLPPTTSTPTISTIPTIPVDPTLPPVDPSGPTDPITGLPGGGVQQPIPTTPPIVNAGKSGLNTPKTNDFNILIVIIPIAVVAVLIIVIAFVIYRRRQSKIPASRTQSSSTSSVMIGTNISQPFEAFTGANQLTSPV